jgi:hypothetical protein
MSGAHAEVRPHIFIWGLFGIGAQNPGQPHQRASRVRAEKGTTWEKLIRAIE